MANEKKIKIMISSPNPGGYNTVAGRAVKEPQEVEVTAEQLRMIRDEAPHVIVMIQDAEEKKPDDPDKEKKPTAEELIAKIGECKTIDEVKVFFKGESRVTVTNAAKAKIAALKDAAKAAEIK